MSIQHTKVDDLSMNYFSKPHRFEIYTELERWILKHEEKILSNAASKLMFLVNRMVGQYTSRLAQQTHRPSYKGFSLSE